MTDLAAQILAALDRAEETAQAATPGPWEYGGEVCGENLIRAGYGSPHDGCLVADAFDVPDDAAHVAANDPAHVLRLCAALREVVKLHYAQEHALALKLPDDPWRTCAECGNDAPCPTLAALASVWDVPGDNT